MFKIDWLVSFSRVAHCGSFTEAARKAGLTPMALSKHVSHLEAQLGEPLFERSTRSVRLTEFGTEFLERANQLIREQESLRDWVNNRTGAPSGTLKVIGSANALSTTVVPHVGEFRARYPSIELEIDALSDLDDPLVRPFDVAWGVSQYLGELRPGLVRRRLLTTPFGVFASPDYLRRHGNPAHPRDLQDHAVIAQLHDKPNDFLIIRETGAEEDGLPYVQMRAPIKASLGHLDFCIQGLGLINASPRMPEVRRAVQLGLIVPVLEAFWFRSLDLYVYFHQVRQRQPKVDAFVDFFTARLGASIGPG